MSAQPVLKCAIYARVSTEDQKCAMQLENLGAFCKRSGWETVEYTEKISGKAGVRRPALEQLMADARMKKFDVVVVWKLDRFGRSLEHLLQNIRELDRHGVRFCCPDQGIDTDNKSPLGRFLIHILGAFAELEHSFTVERVTAGVESYKAAFKAGRIGKTRESRSGKNKPHGRPRAVFDRKKLLALHQGGASERAIARELKISKTVVHKFLATAASALLAFLTVAVFMAVA